MEDYESTVDDEFEEDFEDDDAINNNNIGKRSGEIAEPVTLQERPAYDKSKMRPHSDATMGSFKRSNQI